MTFLFTPTFPATNTPAAASALLALHKAHMSIGTQIRISESGLPPSEVFFFNGDEWALGGGTTPNTGGGLPGGGMGSGPKGDKGDQGIQGEKGAKGDKGDTGTFGLKGDQGIQGKKGEQGETGLTGPAGEKGETGLTGPAGEKGETGEKGDQGEIGPEGKSVYQLARIEGFMGSELDLLDSLRGPRGEKGESGVSASLFADAVDNGFLGTYGEYALTLKGEAGVAGQSAFSSAVNNGFLGPESLWLESLRGETGVQGEIGPKGDQGEIGEQGIQGEIGPKGEQGEIGPKGEQGEIGPSGNTASLFADALDNGFVGTFEEYFQALRGETGAKGETGEQGIQGEPGPKGDKGEIGPSGVNASLYNDAMFNGFDGTYEEYALTIKGDPGEKGDTGEDGPPGPKGDRGEIGLTGPQGERGEKGESGVSTSLFADAVDNGFLGTYEEYALTLKGAPGIKGDQGEVGPPGEQGADGLDGAQGEIGLPGANGQDAEFLQISGLVVVAKNGDDITGNGTYGKPFASISHAQTALDLLDPDVAGVIQLMPGIYTEDVELVRAKTILRGLGQTKIIGVVKITPDTPSGTTYDNLYALQNVTIEQPLDATAGALTIDGEYPAHLHLQNIEISSMYGTLAGINFTNTAPTRNLLTIENAIVTAEDAALYLDNVDCTSRGYFNARSVTECAVTAINCNIEFTTGCTLSTDQGLNAVNIGPAAVAKITFASISNNSPASDNANCIWVEDGGVLAIGSTMLLSTAPQLGDPENTGFAITGEVGGFVNYVNLQFNGVDRIGAGPTLVAGDVEPTIIP